jgi:predicted DNA-binding protein with PD1-like motif
MAKEKSLLSSMGSQSIQRIVQFHVEVGADLLKAIEEAVRREKIKSGVFVSGLGALSKGIFRNVIHFPKEYPVKDDNRLYLNVETPLELVSLGGWVASKPDGTPEIHCHFSASTVVGSTVTTLGGHLTHGTLAGIKVVVAIAVLPDEAASAVYDDYTKSIDVSFE